VGKIIRLHKSLTRASSATQYTAGDQVCAAAFDFALPEGMSQGRILSLGLDIIPASGNLVITALDGFMWMWKSADAPAAVADNAALSLTGGQMTDNVARFAFSNGAWINPLGALTASTAGHQHMTPASHGVAGAPFSFDNDGLAFNAARTLNGLIQITAAWNPGAVANVFHAHLDIEID
jgi:hypothetical protein